MAEKLALGKVTFELTDRRGPDVRSKVTVPRRWFATGGQLNVTRPRLASCEGCGGGGCATCGYQGAFSLSDSDQEPTVVPVQLPAQAVETVVTVRLPHLGYKRQSDEVAGHWLLEVHPGATFSGAAALETPQRRAWPWPWIVLLTLAALASLWVWWVS